LSEAAAKFHKYLADSNPGALEKALEMIYYYIENGGPGQFETTKLIKCLLEKCLSAKQSIKDTSIDLCNHFFRKGQKDELFAQSNTVITKNLTVPKFVIGVYDMLTELLARNGPQKMDMLKPFIASTVKACGSSKPQVKDAVVGGY
jgi:hypothetical protein